MVRNVNNGRVLAATRLRVRSGLYLSDLDVVFSPIKGRSVLAISRHASIGRIHRIVRTIRVRAIHLRNLSTVIRCRVSTNVRRLRRAVVFDPLTNGQRNVALAMVRVARDLREINALVRVNAITNRVASLIRRQGLTLCGLNVENSTGRVVTRLVNIGGVSSLALQTLLIFLPEYLRDLRRAGPG